MTLSNFQFVVFFYKIMVYMLREAEQGGGEHVLSYSKIKGEGVPPPPPPPKIGLKL